MSMIPMQSDSFGRPIAIFTRYKILEDSTKIVKNDAVIFSGMPVAISAAHDANDGQIIAALTNAKIYGLAKFNKNSYSDEVNDAFGMYGSGKGNVVVKGIVEIQPNVFTLNDGTEVVVNTYDVGQTYYPNDPLYVELADSGKLGQITKVAVAGNNATFVGYVLVAPDSNGVMQILLP